MYEVYCTWCVSFDVPHSSDHPARPCLPDLYVYAVLVCCVGILSVLLFTLTIIWQSVFSKRKSRGKRTDKVMSGTGAQPNHRQVEDTGRSTTLGEKYFVRLGLFTFDWGAKQVRRCVSFGLC